MGRKRKFATPAVLESAWKEYRAYCNAKAVTVTEFSAKEGKFVTAEIPHPVTCTVKGFCAYHGMTEANFYAVYNQDAKFEPVIARMKQECEIDAREKFENGTINSRLAGLWMSNYGYTMRSEAQVSSSVDVTIVDDIGDEDG